LGVNATTKGDVLFSNNFSVMYGEGWFRMMEADTSGQPVSIDTSIVTEATYPVRGYYNTLPRGWVVNDIRKAEIWQWKNATKITWDMPTNKGLQIWRWFVRLKNPLKLSFDVLYTYNKTTTTDHIWNKDPAITPNKKVVPFTTIWDVKQSATYQFSDKISSEAWIKYTRKTDVLSGSNSSTTTETVAQKDYEEITSTLAYEMMVRMRF
jgi:hypothetical protein